MIILLSSLVELPARRTKKKDHQIVIALLAGFDLSIHPRTLTDWLTLGSC